MAKKMVGLQKYDFSYKKKCIEKFCCMYAYRYNNETCYDKWIHFGSM